MYQRSAASYDTVFRQRRDHAAEAARVHGWIEQHRRPDAPGNHLLDVACGTGIHLPHLRRCYDVTGLDLSAEMLAIARRQNPETVFHQGDFVHFALGEQFTAVVCLGSAIGYARTLPAMRQAIQTMADHVVPGGVVIVEPWFAPDVWENGRISVDVADEPECKVARMIVSGLDATGTIATLDIHHLVGTAAGVESFVERHELGLFTPAVYLAAFAAAGLVATHDPDGLIGRGIYIGVKVKD